MVWIICLACLFATPIILSLLRLMAQSILSRRLRMVNKTRYTSVYNTLSVDSYFVGGYAIHAWDDHCIKIHWGTLTAEGWTEAENSMRWLCLLAGKKHAQDLFLAIREKLWIARDVLPQAGSVICPVIDVSVTWEDIYV
jgi:hypothetical protein